MCKRECYYRNGPKAGFADRTNERICDYARITGRTRTAELVDAYRKKGKRIGRSERIRILTDEKHCPWYAAPGEVAQRNMAVEFFNNRETTKLIQCQACRRTFTGGVRTKYCPDCRDEKKRERQAAWWNAEVIVTCGDCGAKFKGTRHMKYCEACRKKRMEAAGRASAGHRGRGPSKKKEKSA